MKIRFDHVGIIARTDRENQESAAFFADVLGLPVEGDPAAGYAEVRADGSTIALHRGGPVPGVRPHGGTLLQFRCDDVPGAVEEIRRRGGTVAVEPHRADWGTVSAYVSGPNGILVELYDEPSS
ncbi:MAG: VOC family protein [Micromonosporaceae bacterium]|jgi:catechol 2,3-dioxygenase-like lactoylglutathione lyase family enzyme